MSKQYNCIEKAQIEIIDTSADKVVAIMRKEDFRSKVLINNLSNKELELNHSYHITYSRLEESVLGVDESIYVCEYTLIVDVQ